MHMIDYLVHFSNLLMLLSYSVRNILWLRWFAVAAALTNIPYFLLQADILWPPVIWAVVFTCMNLYQIVHIYLARRSVVLSEDEERLYRMGFDRLTPREFVSLVLAGEWKTAAAGEKVLTEGQPASAVCVAVSGSAQIRRDEREIADLGPGHVIGTALALTGEPSPVSASFAKGARYLSWPLGNIRAFLDRRPELRTTIQGLVNRDLAAKVEGAVRGR